MKASTPVRGGVLIEAVPNLSLGPSDDALEHVRTLLRTEASPGWAWLDEHTDPDHARTVLTLAGAPAPLLRVLDAMLSVLDEHATLEGHTGVHPRVGVLDVLPLVPLAQATWADARALAERFIPSFVRREIPVYRYARLAKSEDRARLAVIRREVEWFGRSETPGLPPDDGPGHLHPRLGATCLGVRAPLVAYNVLLDTQDVELGRAIARSLRPANGGLEGVQALAFQLTSREGRVQVSTNLVDTHATTLADIFSHVKEHARAEGVATLSGELVGLAPERALPDDPADAGLHGSPTSLEDKLAEHGFPASVPV